MKKQLLIIAFAFPFWVSAQLKTVNQVTTNHYIGSFAAGYINNTFYFPASDQNNPSAGSELFKSDGTTAGTVLIKDINANSYSSSTPQNFNQLNATSILFNASTAANGKELWITDGTEANTKLVKDIYPGTNNGPFAHFQLMGSTMYFMADDGVNGYELWKSDGTNTGTQLVKNINPSGNGMRMPELVYSKYTAVLNNELFFVASNITNGFELYKTDGTTAGTVLVKDINVGANSSDPSNLVVINNTLFFSASTPSNGTELWKTDGTSAGTVLVKDFTEIGSSKPDYFATLNNKLYFSAIVNNNATICESDGTEKGTFPLFSTTNFSTEFRRLTKVDTSICFFESGMGSSPIYNLYTYNSALNTTKLIKSGMSGASAGPIYQPTKEKCVGFNGMLYFSFNNTTNGDELWQSDGTAAGTIMITDIAIGSTTSWIDNLFPVNNGSNSRLYFTSTAKPGLLYILSDAVATGFTENFEVASTINLYPNPSKGVINVELKIANTEPTTIEITNVVGQVVLTTTEKANKFTLKTNDLKSGIYFLTLTNNGKKATEKIMVE